MTDLQDPPRRSTVAARTQGATKIYGSGDTAVRALDGVDVKFPTGQLAAIMGPSGSGKSTLMHCMAGLDQLTDGRCWVGDQALDELDDKALTRLRRDRLGFVFQSFNLVPTLNASENIRLPLDLAGTAVDRGWFDQLVTTLGLDDRLGHLPNEMSGGQQQRVAVARALVTRPDLVLADEPTGNLDTTSSGELLGFLRAAVDEFDQTVVMVTHDPTAAAIADRVVFLADGKIVDELADPTADGILDRMRELGG